MGVAQMLLIAGWIARVLEKPADEAVARETAREVLEGLARAYPLFFPRVAAVPPARQCRLKRRRSAFCNPSGRAGRTTHPVRGQSVARVGGRRLAPSVL